MKPTPLYRSALFALSCLLTGLTASPAAAAETALQPGAVWADTQGKPIQAHGGGILFHEGVYYWYGENKDGPTAKDGACGARVEVVGVSAYKSKDLVNWVPLGLVLSAVPEEPAHDLHPTKILERPKVIYNPGTKKFVMWMHIDDKNYALARAGVATADQPAGPFTYLGSVKPDNTDSRDLTVFQDEDNSAWLTGLVTTRAPAPRFAGPIMRSTKTTRSGWWSATRLPTPTSLTPAAPPKPPRSGLGFSTTTSATDFISTARLRSGFPTMRVNAVSGF
jgi:hypothetical protein